jgi:hypothetical protein
MRPLISRIDALLAGTLTDWDEIQLAKAAALDLNEDLSRWEDNQPIEWRPTPFGVWRSCDDTSGDSIFWPGLVDGYFDRKHIPPYPIT